jgi:Galactose oxidase, central domain
MITPRVWHPATLLNNGQVLIAGGEGIFSAELYDPETGAFLATGRMTTVRGLHTATLLPDGKVLIAGGRSREAGPQRLASAELYDPDTRTFNLVGDMTKPRSSHTATRLNNGNVLIAGGWSPSSETASAELYVPRLLVPALVVADLRFDQSSVSAGSSYAVNVLGSNLTPQTFFDIRFTAPGSNTTDVVLNWQRGLAATHDVPAGTASGIWKINGVRAHQNEADHTGNFVPVNATITVSLN